MSKEKQIMKIAIMTVSLFSLSQDLEMINLEGTDEFSNNTTLF
jgi:hypothetical protein